MAAMRSASATALRRPTSPAAPPTSEISTASVKSCRRMRLRLDPKREPQSNFAPTVSGARGKQAAEVGACSQQNQSRQQHQPRQKCSHCREQKSRHADRDAPVKSWLGHRLWDKSFPDRNQSTVQIGRRLRRSDSRLQTCPAPQRPTAIRAHSGNSPRLPASALTIGTKKSGEKNNKCRGTAGGATPRMVKGCLFS